MKNSPLNYQILLYPFSQIYFTLQTGFLYSRTNPHISLFTFFYQLQSAISYMRVLYEIYCKLLIFSAIYSFRFHSQTLNLY